MNITSHLEVLFFFNRVWETDYFHLLV
jgi:hypothetical protein